MSLSILSENSTASLSSTEGRVLVLLTLPVLFLLSNFPSDITNASPDYADNDISIFSSCIPQSPSTSSEGSEVSSQSNHLLSAKDVSTHLQSAYVLRTHSHQCEHCRSRDV